MVFRFLLFIAVCTFTDALHCMAQIVPAAPMTLQNAPQRDTSNKTNSADWKDESARIYYRKLNSEKKYIPDTSIHHFQRRSFSQPWYTNTGNSGSPQYNMLFTPEYRMGPALGYHVYDRYRFHTDSLCYYNTTRPYSEFLYQLGSKIEQQVAIMHTQNVKPNWNFAAQYRKVSSPGYYKLQRTGNDNAWLSSNYQSNDQHYSLNAGIVYNKEITDENGGIAADSFLASPDFKNRQVIPVLFQDDAYNVKRSSVTNRLRDVGFLLQHSYVIGKPDTTYNEDSTQYFYHLIPKFSITHRLQAGSEKYQYKDYTPDSARYLNIFRYGFTTEDSVSMIQKWFYTDNSLSLNGFIGKEDKQLLVSAGVGIRTDKFTTDNGLGKSSENFISNYLLGSLKKEALEEKQWDYEANVKFFFTGQTAGNFLVNASLGKDISAALGTLNIGFSQALNNAPYNYTIYQNQYYKRVNDYNKESVTQLFAIWNNDKFKCSAGIRNYLVANYIYINEQQDFDQYAKAFNITQIWLNKIFRFGVFVLDNELMYQQKTAGAPVNVPQLMGRHQLAVETRAFKKTLQIASGIDMRYHTPYKSAAYAPFFNRFYYQDNYTASNYPEVSLFFNFRLKNFRAYIMTDQMQQLFTENNIQIPGYPAQNFMIRFGFSWVMIN